MIKHLRLILLIFSIICTAIHSNAQDIHFSQFNENASLVNPAMVAQEQSLKASLIYKDQWRSVSVPYKTMGAEVELGFKPNTWKRREKHSTRTFRQTDRWNSAGLSFFNDKAGDGNMGLTQVNLSFSSNVPITRKSTLSAGMQASIVQRKIDFGKLVWPDQYNGTGYDPNINSGENSSTDKYIYPDFAAGLLWSYGYKESAIASNDNFKMDIGASMYHLNRAKQQFLVTASSQRLFTKYVLHSKFTIGIPNSNISILPSVIVQLQGPSTEFIGGTYVRYSFSQNSKYTGNVQSSYFSLGAFVRSRDAFIACAQLNFSQYAIGFSYDINTSQLKTASTLRGGFEVFIRFVNHSPFLYQNDRK